MVEIEVAVAAGLDQLRGCGHDKVAVRERGVAAADIERVQPDGGLPHTKATHQTKNKPRRAAPTCASLAPHARWSLGCLAPPRRTPWARWTPGLGAAAEQQEIEGPGSLSLGLGLAFVD